MAIPALFLASDAPGILPGGVAGDGGNSLGFSIVDPSTGLRQAQMTLLRVTGVCLDFAPHKEYYIYEKCIFRFYLSQSQRTVLCAGFYCTKNEGRAFPLCPMAVKAAVLYVDNNDDWLVQKAASLLQGDIQQVKERSQRFLTLLHVRATIAYIGSEGKSSLSAGLRQKKNKPRPAQGKWKPYIMQVVANPLPGVAQALVIAGSDRRGTAMACLNCRAGLAYRHDWWPMCR